VDEEFNNTRKDDTLEPKALSGAESFAKYVSAVKARVAAGNVKAKDLRANVEHVESMARSLGIRLDERLTNDIARDDATARLTALEKSIVAYNQNAKAVFCGSKGSSIDVSG
jgi:hypothetical protein